jgi:hypothetical protein
VERVLRTCCGVIDSASHVNLMLVIKLNGPQVSLEWGTVLPNVMPEAKEVSPIRRSEIHSKFAREAGHLLQVLSERLPLFGRLPRSGVCKNWIDRFNRHDASRVNPTES